MGSQPGSAPELNLSSAGMPQFFHSLGKCSLTATQGQESGRLRSQPTGSAPEESKASCQKIPKLSARKEFALGPGSLPPSQAAVGWTAHALHALTSFYPFQQVQTPPQSADWGRRAWPAREARTHACLQEPWTSHYPWQRHPIEQGLCLLWGHVWGHCLHPNSLEAKRVWLWPASSLLGNPIF